jgi:protein phosphatase
MKLHFKHANKPLLHRSERSSAAPASSPGHDTVAVKNREGAQTVTGSTARLSWGARSDVGLVRSHNEDSFLVRAPLFAVCDGMGGHAAGEVASAIAVQSLADQAPMNADDILLGAAVEAANTAVIKGASEGKGKAGMGSTCTCLLIEDDHMAIAHVGDSRLYLLHRGTLVRLTHDHSYVEELVDAGEITADEARVHPSRSVITRALGSDPDMYADHFTLNVSTEDRLILCSDGLSSMIEDSEIEAIAVSSATPQAAADNLVAAALTAGGHDNVTVIVVDVIDDGLEDRRRKKRHRTVLYVSVVTLAIVATLVGLLAIYVQSSWYIANYNGTVGIYHGVNYTVFGLNLSQLDVTTSVEVSDLPQTVQDDLDNGIMMSSEDDARQTIESYRAQIDQEKTSAAETAGKSTEGTNTTPDNPATPESDNTTSSTTSGDE